MLSHILVLGFKVNCYIKCIIVVSVCWSEYLLCSESHFPETHCKTYMYTSVLKWLNLCDLELLLQIRAECRKGFSSLVYIVRYPTFSLPQNHMEGLLNCMCQDLIPRGSDSVGLYKGQRICISNKFPDDEPHFGNPCVKSAKYSISTGN